MTSEHFSSMFPLPLFLLLYFIPIYILYLTGHYYFCVVSIYLVAHISAPCNVLHFFLLPSGEAWFFFLSERMLFGAPFTVGLQVTNSLKLCLSEMYFASICKGHFCWIQNYRLVVHFFHLSEDAIPLFLCFVEKIGLLFL